MAKKSVLKQSKKAPKDFEKIKNKVGKKKKAARNETRIDFKVKRVQMPAQRSLEEKGEEVTHRRLGLLELLAHSQHHSPKVRRDSFRGLLELCSAHDGVLKGNLARIMESAAAAPMDANAEVREEFRRFQSWLLAELSLEAIGAFASTLALHVRGALSHVSADVREDGLLLLELYLTKLGSASILGRVDIARMICILCQLHVRPDIVLSCLYKLVEQHRAASIPKEGEYTSDNGVLPQQSLESLLASVAHREVAKHDTGASPTEAEDQWQSPLWAFCLRVWLQAGELPRSGATSSNLGRRIKSGEDMAAKPGLTRLKCASLLQRALEMARDGERMDNLLNPSADQIFDLVNIVRRKEWPIRVEVDGHYRRIADAINLRMARVFSLLAVGGAPQSAAARHVTVLARTALSYLVEFCYLPCEDGKSGVKGISAISLEMSGDVSDDFIGMLSGAAGMAHALCSFDLLWCCVLTGPAPKASDGGWGADKASTLFVESVLNEAADLTLLSDSLARLLDGVGADETARCVSAPTLLSLPLSALLIGISPTAAAASCNIDAGTPTVLRASWPRGLIALGEPSLLEAEAVGSQELNMAAFAMKVVMRWPKQLWYLGASEPVLSSFILGLLLELAKKAARSGSLYQSLFRSSCPLLMPFIVGLPSTCGVASEMPPPLLFLSLGAQLQAAALVSHIPRLGEELVVRLIQTICRWSTLGLHSASKGAGLLEVECCELLLEAVLRGGRTDAMENKDQILFRRLRAALTLLLASSSSVVWEEVEGEARALVVRQEALALRLYAIIADWLIDDATKSAGFAGSSCSDDAAERADILCYDEGRRLGLEAVAWPLCQQALRTADSRCDVVAPRVVCLLHLCTLHLAWVPARQPYESADTAQSSCCAFLRQLFNILVVDSFGLAICPKATGSAVLNVAALLEGTSLERLGGPALEKAIADAAASAEVQDAGRLAQLMVSIWMRLVAESERDLAYELLAKLCSWKFGSECSESSSLQVDCIRNACAWLLAEAIRYRSDRALSTAKWGRGLPGGGLADAQLAGVRLEPAGAAEVRALLQAEARSAGCPRGRAYAELRSMLQSL